ncbi:hypothetical protein, partial [Pseudomonas sp. UMC65]|uniref:hypothetical protein n=1 Tax=Pseudomonas sp. UMC65 TaxID=1862323 RepID=UPI001C7F2957
KGGGRWSRSKIGLVLAPAAPGEGRQAEQQGQGIKKFIHTGTFHSDGCQQFKVAAVICLLRFCEFSTLFC